MEDESANNAKAAAVIASLANKNSNEPRGVRVEQGVNNKSRGAIRRDDEGGGIKDILQVKATLTTNEVAKYKKIFSIFKSVVTPGPEAETLQSAKLKQKLPVQLPKSSEGAAGKGGGSWLKKLIGPALLILGGLAALVSGLMSDGAAKGLLKILAKVGIGGGIKWFASKFAGIGKTITSVFKGLGKMLLTPLKGLGKMLLTPLKGLGDKLLKPLKGLGAKLIEPGLIGKMVDTVKTKVKSVFSSIKGALLKPFKALKGGAIGGIFKKVGGMLFKLLKPVLKRIPGIGSMISWAFAVSRFKSGDVVGGLIDVASGIATLFPGVGTAIGIGLDVLNAFLDTKKGKEEKVKPAGSGFKIGKFFGKIKDKIMNNYPIKNLMEFWGGAADVVGGDIKGGLQRMAFAIPFAKPLADWLFGATNEEGERGGGALAKAGNVMMELKSTLAKKMLSMLPEKMFGISIRARLGKMFGVDMGTVNDEVDNQYAEKQYAARSKYGRREGEVGMVEFRKNASSDTLNSPEAVEFARMEKIMRIRRGELQKAFATKDQQNIKGAEAAYTAANIGYMKSQRAFRDAANKSPMQDFIVQDGKITPFSNKDSVLGMKTGGAIDKLVNKQNEDIKRFSGQLVKIALEHTQILRDIAINTRNSSGGTTVVNAGNNATSKPRTVGVRDAYTS